MLDRQNLFSNAQALTDTGAVLSTDVIDLTARRRLPDLLHVQVQVGTTFTSGGAGTLAVDMVTADNAALDSNAEVIPLAGATALASLTAGRQLVTAGVPRRRLRRYVGLRYTVGTAAMTAGTVTAGLTPDVTDTTAYASGLNTAGI